ncbi:MAG: 2Fe-2S iron-sulfur cluster-binding protein [Cyclobacteriaceae bacterium]
MVKIVIENLGRKELEVSDLTKTVLRHFQDHFVDWMHACGAKGRCTTCKMIVREGKENVEGLTPAEEKYRKAGDLMESERLACQAKVNGNISVVVPRSSRLPHLLYTE